MAVKKTGTYLDWAYIYRKFDDWYMTRKSTPCVEDIFAKISKIVEKELNKLVKNGGN